MSAPLVVNTVDGTCWTRREATRDGQPLYAMADCRRCPELVMATLAELAEHGIAGTADVLPVPAGPVAVRQPVEEVEAERDRLSRDLRGVFGTLDAVRGLLAESTPFLPGDGRDAIVRAVEWLAADRDARRRQVNELQARVAELEAAPTVVYRAEHPDSGIVLGTYSNREAAVAHCEALATREGATGLVSWVPDDSDALSPEELTYFDVEYCDGDDVPSQTCTGYVVTPLEVASAYDPEAEE